MKTSHFSVPSLWHCCIAAVYQNNTNFVTVPTTNDLCISIFKIKLKLESVCFVDRCKHLDTGKSGEKKSGRVGTVATAAHARSSTSLFTVSVMF